MRNILFVIIAALLMGCAGTPSRNGVNRFTLLPHEIENFEPGVTTYQEAVKEFGRPLSYKKDVAKWVNKTTAGSKWSEQHVTAQFNTDGILQGYTVKYVPVPMFGLGFR